MSQQIIDTSSPTDTLPSGFTKVNENFTEVYVSLIKTGMTVDYFGSSAPSGWLFLNGGTIGDAGSGASERQNADTQTLFILLWNSVGDSYCTVSGGRGASAVLDFAAGKTITLPDSRGRVFVGKDTATFGVLGQPIGNETVTLSEGNLPSHSHSVEIPSSTNSVQSGGDFNVLTDSSTTSTGTTSIGSSTPITIIQPSLVCNKIIKL